MSWLVQGFKDHKIVDVFHRPGECDLTVNVDFAYLKEALADVGVCPSYSHSASLFILLIFDQRYLSAPSPNASSSSAWACVRARTRSCARR